MEKIKLMYKSYSIAVHHRKGESGEKLVLLHGGSLDSAMLSWKEVIDLVDGKYDIYAIDMLGYGESDKPDIVYSIPMYVEFLYDVLCQLGIEKTHLAGLSLGGGVSIGFAEKYPHMVDKLALVSAWGYRDRMQFHTICRWYVNSPLNSKSYEWMGKNIKTVRWSITSTLIGDKNKVSEELVTELYNLIHESKSSIAWQSLQRYELGKKGATTDLSSQLGELKMPVLLVNGEKDSAVPAKLAIAASKIIKNSQLHIMKGCKHWPQKERPEEFARVLNKFLSAI